MRRLPDGSHDRSFGRRGSVRFAPGPAYFTGLSDVKVLGSGKILVSGAFKGRFLLARLTARGKLDKSFGGGDGGTVAGLDRCGCAYLAKIATTHRHKIVMLAGYRYGNAYFGLARFTPRGRLDRSFFGDGIFTRNYSPISGARSVMAQRNGKLLAAGFTVDGVVVVRFKG